MADIKHNTPIKNLIIDKTHEPTPKEQQGYFIRNSESNENKEQPTTRTAKGLGVVNDYFTPKVELAKERLLNGETIKSTDNDFYMVSLQAIQQELLKQGMNVSYTIPSRLQNWKELKLIKE